MRGDLPSLRHAALGVAFLSLCTCADAALLQLSEAKAVAGEACVLEVSFSPRSGESVSGIQFDVPFSDAPLAMARAETGPASEEAGKTVSFNQIEAGRYRILVAGINQNVISSGTIARLHIAASPDAAPGRYPAPVAAIIMSDPTGGRVDGSGESGAVRVVAFPEGETEGALEGAPVEEGEQEDAPPPAGCQCAGTQPPRAFPGGPLFLAAATGFLVLAARRMRGKRRNATR